MSSQAQTNKHMEQEESSVSMFSVILILKF